MTATELFRIASGALAVTGPPEWDSPEEPGQRDTLIYDDDEIGEEGPQWVLSPSNTDDGVDLPLDTGMAQRLIESHLRNWLLERGWQVQVTLRKERQRWRLTDCLSLADGGGDRLDADYPFGDDEITVLCGSVVAVAGGR